MLHWGYTVLCLCSVVILASSNDSSIPSISETDIQWLRKEFAQHHAENVPQNDNYLRKVLELVTHAIKTQTDRLQLQDEKLLAQSDEIVSLKREIKVQAKRIKTLERKQKIQIQAKRSQAREIQNLLNLQDKKREKVQQEQQTDKIKKDVSRRIILHSDVDILTLVTTHSMDIKNLQDNMTKISGEVQTIQMEMATMKNGFAKKASGSTYVRWGRKSCPSINGTELVYSGFSGGSHYTDSGAASNYICLSPNPLWGHYNNARDSGAQIYGTEYELNAAGGSSQFFGTNVHNEDAPCSVCRSSRPTVIMIPGRNQCYPGWTMEYKGYLVAGAAGHTAASEYVCLDDRPDVILGGHEDRDGKLFYFVDGRCGSLPCPPYVDGRELTCVVCTK